MRGADGDGDLSYLSYTNITYIPVITFRITIPLKATLYHVPCTILDIYRTSSLRTKQTM